MKLVHMGTTWRSLPYLLKRPLIFVPLALLPVASAQSLPEGNGIWHTGLGGTVASGPMTYAVDGHQYVAVCGGTALYVFALPDPQNP
jgi:hypothetical protein